MTSPQSVETDDLSRATWLVAGASAAAGLIHFSVIAEHSGGQVVVPVGFAAAGVAQVGVAVALIGRRVTRGTLALAIAVNVLATAAWVWSRTAGLPFDPYGGAPEAAGTLDVTSAILQAVAITVAAGLLVAPRVKVPPALAGALALGAVAVAAVVVVNPETPAPDTQAVAATSGAAAPAAGGDGHGHSHGGAAASSTAAAAPGDHAADMLRIDRSRCDLGFNPKAYWEEAYAMNVDTYAGGSMTMAPPSTVADVAGPHLLDGKGSEDLDRLLGLTSISSGEGAAAQLIVALADATDEEYEAWRRWVAANPGGHMDAPADTEGPPPPPSMGHPGPTPWTAMVDRAQCDRLADELAQAREVSERYPTVADAEEAGYFKVTGYVPGIAAHYMNFGILDGTFELDAPEMLLFDGTDQDSRIVGLSYYIQQDGTAGPTQGFVGENDSYHRHFGLCFKPGDGIVGDSTTTEEQCAERGGFKLDGFGGWMSHAWVVPGCESPWGVFSGENPLLDDAMGEATGDDGSEGCAASEARDRYDLSPGESDLAVSGTDEASGR